MRKAYLIPVVLVVLLVAGAVGVYAYDSSRARTIAEGVTVAGVDVGGMTVDRARAKIAKEVARPYERPIAVRAGGDRFELTAKEAKVEANVRGMARTALAESRGGNLLTRTWRDLTGAEADVELPAKVSYSRESIDDLVAEVEGAVNVAAQDAQVTPSGAGLETSPGEAGVNLRSEVLSEAVVREMEHPATDRTVEARMQRVPPEVTQGELVEEYPTYLTVDRGSYELRYYEDLKLQETYSIAVGTTGFETPVGEYAIQNKAVDPAWNVPEWGGSLAGQTIPGGSPENPLKARWLGIYDGAGIHGTDDVASLGTSASHGCVRMAIPDVIELYDRVPVGTPIYIE
jgi:lipoprotein-anchoring transpeptidase ErfK/SrfK